jgi:hypothetical protein
VVANFLSYHPIPWRDSISRPIAPDSPLWQGGDSTTRVVATFYAKPKFLRLFGTNTCTYMYVCTGTVWSKVTRCLSEKVAQNVAKPMVCRNFYITGTLVKSSPKFCSSSVIFEKNYPMYINSPNLVTLFESFAGRHIRHVSCMYVCKA